MTYSRSSSNSRARRASVITLTVFFAQLCATSAAKAQEIGQWATTVIDFSTQYSDTDWSAAQALGDPDTFAYGDIVTAWAPLDENGNLEYITLGFDTPVFATSFLIRETYGNGFVFAVDAVDLDNNLVNLWTGTDPSQPGAPVDFQFNFPQTDYLVIGLRIQVDTNHDLNAWEEIDAVRLLGFIQPAAVGGTPCCGAVGLFAFTLGLVGYAAFVFARRRKC